MQDQDTPRKGTIHNDLAVFITLNRIKTDVENLCNSVKSYSKDLKNNKGYFKSSSLYTEDKNFERFLDVLSDLEENTQKAQEAIKTLSAITSDHI